MKVEIEVFALRKNPHTDVEDRWNLNKYKAEKAISCGMTL